MVHKKRKRTSVILFIVMAVGAICFCCGCSANFSIGADIPILSIFSQKDNSTEIATTNDAADQTEGELNKNQLSENTVMASFSAEKLALDKTINSSTDATQNNSEDGDSQANLSRVCDDYNRFICNMCSSGVITREQWLTSLMYKLGIEKSTEIYDISNDTVGVDISSYYNKDLINTAVSNGILSDAAEKYAPYRAATRQYVAYTLINALGYSRNHVLDCDDSESISDKAHVASALYYGYFKLDENGCFNPQNNITQAEIEGIFNILDTVNQLKDKSILSFGDSIMFGSGNYGVGISDLIADKYKMNVTDYSVGGATFGYVKNKSLIADQINNALKRGETADFILINGGTNDMIRSKFGEISEGFDYKSGSCFDFCSGMEYALGLLREYYPDTPVIYIRPHNMQYSSEENEIIYGSASIDICKKWGVPYVDIYSDTAFNADIMEIRDKYTADIRKRGYGDTVHPNKLGYYTYYLPLTVDKMCELLVR